VEARAAISWTYWWSELVEDELSTIVCRVVNEAQLRLFTINVHIPNKKLWGLPLSGEAYKNAKYVPVN
jgi:hypothetical protein